MTSWPANLQAWALKGYQPGQDESASELIGSNVIPRRARPGLAGLGLPSHTPEVFRLKAGLTGGSHGVIPLSCEYKGTSPIRKRLPLGPFGRPIPRALWRS